jgi:2-amino-4-hydroxy-6-hydroxymethyldihydropteridine diphosphokinase
LTEVALGLGGNIGDSRTLMAKALRELASTPGVTLMAVSALYETPPWGKTDQPPFLNAAALIETTLSPRALLDAILDVERKLGRQRTERWGPRTVDIDILLVGDDAIDEPGLKIPHPHLHERAFALRPLVEVMPNAAFGGRRAEEWLAETDRSGMKRMAGPGWAD